MRLRLGCKEQAAMGVLVNLMEAIQGQSEIDGGSLALKAILTDSYVNNE